MFISRCKREYGTFELRNPLNYYCSSSSSSSSSCLYIKDEKCEKLFHNVVLEYYNMRTWMAWYTMCKGKPMLGKVFVYFIPSIQRDTWTNKTRHKESKHLDFKWLQYTCFIIKFVLVTCCTRLPMQKKNLAEFRRRRQLQRTNMNGATSFLIDCNLYFSNT